MNHEIKDILRLYETILDDKKILSEQVDIYGIDELVYNPATKKGGDIGFGFDRGKKRPIKWDNHDGHLHIGFTNRDVAIDVINQANSMGLNTTENLIAKRDATGYIEDEHDDYSFHYRLFPGEPFVTAGVDINGSHSTIVDLIKWILEKYASNPPYSSMSPDFKSMTYSGLKKLVPSGKGKPIIDKNLIATASLTVPTSSSVATTSSKEITPTTTSQSTSKLEPSSQIGSEEDDDNLELKIPEVQGDPILKIMAQSIFKEDKRKTKKLLDNIDKIKNLL